MAAPLALAAVAVAVYLLAHSALAGHPHTQSNATQIVTTTKGRRTRRRTPRFYVVKAGDTLSAISIKTHVPIYTLTSLNPSLSPNSLQSGQRLRLRR